MVLVCHLESLSHLKSLSCYEKLRKKTWSVGVVMISDGVNHCATARLPQYLHGNLVELLRYMPKTWYSAGNDGTPDIYHGTE